MEKHDEMISTGETPDSSTRALWQSYLSPSCKSGGKGDVNDEFCLTMYLFHTSKGSLTCKILQHGAEADSFTSPLKEGMLRIFVTLCPSPSATFKSANLGSNGRYANH
jgi:hypothetical protein